MIGNRKQRRDSGKPQRALTVVLVVLFVGTALICTALVIPIIWSVTTHYALQPR
jgi:hypothetical protein